MNHIPNGNTSCSDGLLQTTIKNLYGAPFRPDRPEYLLQAIKESALGSQMKIGIQQFIESSTSKPNSVPKLGNKT